MKWLQPYSDHAYALLRIMAGYMFCLHGFQKLFGLMSNFQPAAFSQLWFAGIIELVGGLLILLGLGTRIAAFICSGEMAVAYLQAHWKLHFGADFFPVVNKGELALLYSFVFLFIATRGGVKWCLDKTSSSEPATG